MTREYRIWSHNNDIVYYAYPIQSYSIFGEVQQKIYIQLTSKFIMSNSNWFWKAVSCQNEFLSWQGCNDVANRVIWSEIKHYLLYLSPLTFIECSYLNFTQKHNHKNSIECKANIGLWYSPDLIKQTGLLLRQGLHNWCFACLWFNSIDRLKSKEKMATDA